MSYRSLAPRCRFGASPYLSRDTRGQFFVSVQFGEGSSTFTLSDEVSTQRALSFLNCSNHKISLPTYGCSCASAQLLPCASVSSTTMTERCCCPLGNEMPRTLGDKSQLLLTTHCGCKLPSLAFCSCLDPAEPLGGTGGYMRGRDRGYMHGRERGLHA